MAVYDALTRGVAQALGLFAPGMARRWLRERARLRAACAGYGGARRDGANGGYRPLDGNVNARNLRDRRLLQARARQLADDHPLVAGALEKLVNNVIFQGFRPQVQLRAADGAYRDAENRRLEQRWRDWAEAVRWHDVERLALRHCVTDGGCLVHHFPRRDFLARGLAPLGLELLPLDALDEGVWGLLPNGNRAVGGVEIDRYGDPVAWHVRRDALYGDLSGVALWPAPGAVSSVSVGESVRLPRDTCHMLSRPRRIGELLPVSWLHAVIMSLHDLDEYESSERIGARLAAAFGVFVTQKDEYAYAGNDLTGQARAPLSGGHDSAGRVLSGQEFVSQGRIDVLPPGMDIRIAEHNRPGGNYEPFVKQITRSVSTGLGMSYESFSNNYSDASYSSARQAVLEERRGYRALQEFLLRGLCEPVWKVWCGRQAAFFGMAWAESAPVRWQRAGWSWVDPQKDANANALRHDMGLVSLTELCAEEGRDFGDVVAQISADRAALRAALGRPGGTDHDNETANP